MKQPLPLLFLAALAAATPASAQYVFVDTNGDGACDASDFLPYGDGTLDVWLDTNHEQDGSPATCATGEPLSISAYDVVLLASTTANATVTYRGWTNAMAQFTVSRGTAQEGDFFWAGCSSPDAQTYLPPGKYKLGTLSLTGGGSGCAWIYPAASATIAGVLRETDFNSQCLGADYDYTLRLGADFVGLCGTAGVCDGAATPPNQTTWGKIKDRYRR